MTAGALGPPPEELPPDPSVAQLRGTLLVRFFNPARGGALEGRSFGPLSEMRFDHHPSKRGDHRDISIWYAATSLRGAVAEAYGRVGILDSSSGHRVAVVRVTGSLRVLDLVGAAARRVGVTQEIAATTRYDLTQKWARAFHGAYDLHGLRWRGRQLGSICVALYERAPRKALIVTADHAISHAAVWPRIARAARDCRIRVV